MKKRYSIAEIIVEAGRLEVGGGEQFPLQNHPLGTEEEGHLIKMLDRSHTDKTFRVTPSETWVYISRTG